MLCKARFSVCIYNRGSKLLKKILITGENGYIGNSLCSYLESEFTGEYSVDKVSVKGDSLQNISFCGYDVVLHLAGIVHRKESAENTELYYQVNTQLTQQIAEKCIAESVGHLVFMSTMSVYGMKNGTITASTVPQPTNHYGKSKLMAEKALLGMQDKIKIAIVRPPMVYGADCVGNYATLSRFAKKLPVFPRIKNRRSMIYIENLCEFLRLLVENSDTGIFMPQNSQYMCTADIVAMIAGCAQKKIALTPLFNWCIRLMVPLSGTLGKLFGDLVYEQSLSQYRQGYNICDIETSIKRSEKQ